MSLRVIFIFVTDPLLLTYGIPAIRDPHKAMADILAGAAPHQGLEIQVRDE
jgi:hypothetical protein